MMLTAASNRHIIKKQAIQHIKNWSPGSLKTWILTKTSEFSPSKITYNNIINFQVQ